MYKKLVELGGMKGKTPSIISGGFPATSRAFCNASKQQVALEVTG